MDSSAFHPKNAYDPVNHGYFSVWYDDELGVGV
jgi:hypothetical protein